MFHLQAALMLNLARRELIDRHAGSVLGGLWVFLLPLINILIFVVIFSRLMGARLPGIEAPFSRYGYTIYLVAGLLPWNAFAATLLRVTGMFREKAHLIAKVRLPLLQLPLFVLVVETVVFAISMVFFLLFLLFIHFPLSWHWVWIPLIYGVQQGLAYGLGLLGAILSVFIRDIREFVTVAVQLWFWLTPIVYLLDILPAPLREWWWINPAAVFVDAYHRVILWHRVPDLASLGGWCLAALALGAAVVWIFHKLERDIRDFL